MKTYQQLEYDRLRACMRSHALEYRKAISPQFWGDWNQRTHWAIDGLRIAKMYRRLAEAIRHFPEIHP